MKTLKKTECVLLCGALLLSMSACSNQAGLDSALSSVPSDNSSATSSATSPSPSNRLEYDKESPTGGRALPLFDTPRKLSLMAEGGDNWHKENDVLQTIKEHIGIDIEFITFAESALREKYQTMTATGNLPDICVGLHQSYSNLDKLAKNNVLEPLDDYLDQMPNFRQALEDFPDAAERIKASDGKMYIAFGNGYYAPWGVANCFVYSPDWLKQEGVAPKLSTWQEVTETARELKKANPEAYPFLSRGDFYALLNRMAPQFATDTGIYYDEASDKWIYGPTAPGFQDLVNLVSQWYKEGLLHPETPTMNDQQYYSIVLNKEHTYQGGAFLFEDTTWHKSGLNTGTPEEPYYPFELLLPPQGLANGEQKVRSDYSYKVIYSNGHTVTKNAKDKEACMAFLDYTYSKEGRMLLSWGEEGKHYNMETIDGISTPVPIQYQDKPFNKNDIYSTYVNNTMFGWNYGFYGFNTIMPDYNLSSPLLPKDKVEAQKLMLDADAVLRSAPIIWFNDLQSPFISVKTEALATYVKAAVTQFCMGERPMSDWNAFMNELTELGCKDYEAMYNEVWKKS